MQTNWCLQAYTRVGTASWFRQVLTTLEFARRSNLVRTFLSPGEIFAQPRNSSARIPCTLFHSLPHSATVILSMVSSLGDSMSCDIKAGQKSAFMSLRPENRTVFSYSWVYSIYDW